MGFARRGALKDAIAVETLLVPVHFLVEVLDEALEVHQVLGLRQEETVLQHHVVQGAG